MSRGSILPPLAIFSAVVFAALMGGLSLLSIPFHWAYPGAVLWFMALTLFMHTWMERVAEREPALFVTRYMTALVLKMISSLIVVVAILVTLPRAQGVPLALVFAVLYLLFLVFSTLRFSARMKASRQ